MPIQTTPIESIINQPNGLAGLNSSGRVSAPSRDIPSIRDYGSVGTGNDDTTVIQSAIDAASSEGFGKLLIPAGTFRVSSLRMKNRVHLIGAGVNSTATTRRVSRIDFINNSGSHPAGILIDRPTDVVEFCTIDGVFLSCNAFYQTIVRNIESHWFSIKNSYLSGNPTVAAIWLGATLYTRIEDNIISMNNLATAIDASEDNHSVAYYGTNASFIRRNSIFNQGIAIKFAGGVDIAHNNIEGGTSNCDAKIVMSGPSASQATIRFNYFEAGRSDQSTKPTKFFWVAPDGQGQVLIEGNVLGSGRRPGGSVAIDLAARPVRALIVNNRYGNFDTHVIGPSSTGSIKRVAETKQGFPSNGRPAIDYGGPYYSPRWIGGGNADYGSWVDDNDGEIVRFQTVDRSPWQEPIEAAPSLLLRRGQNIAFGSLSSVTVDRVNDAGLFPGTVVTFIARSSTVSLGHNVATSMHSVVVTATGSGYTTATATISGGGGSGATADVVVQDGSVKFINLTNAGSGYTSTPTVTITGDGSGATAVAIRQAPLMLAKGANAVLPAGRSIQFVVDMNRRLSEIGDYTVRL